MSWQANDAAIHEDTTDVDCRAVARKDGRYTGQLPSSLQGMKCQRNDVAIQGRTT